MLIRQMRDKSYRAEFRFPKLTQLVHDESTQSALQPQRHQYACEGSHVTSEAK